MPCYDNDDNKICGATRRLNVTHYCHYNNYCTFGNEKRWRGMRFLPLTLTLLFRETD